MNIYFQHICAVVCLFVLGISLLRVGDGEGVAKNEKRGDVRGRLLYSIRQPLMVPMFYRSCTMSKKSWR